MSSMWKNTFGLSVSLQYDSTNFDFACFVLSKLNKVQLPACTEWTFTINDEKLHSVRFRSVGIYSCLFQGWKQCREEDCIIFWRGLKICTYFLQHFWRSSLLEIILDKPFHWCLKAKDCNRGLVCKGKPEVKEDYPNLSFFSNLKAIKKWTLKSKATL